MRQNLANQRGDFTEIFESFVTNYKCLQVWPIRQSCSQPSTSVVKLLIHA